MKKLAILFLALIGALVWLACQTSALQREVADLKNSQAAFALESEREKAVAMSSKRVEIEQLNAKLHSVEQRLLDKSPVERDIPSFGASREDPIQSNIPQPPQGPVELGPSFSSSHSPTGELLHRSWGPEQLIGPPNTEGAGDLPTAWAPLESTATGEEWIHLNYDRSVELAQLRVRETYNPGVISKIAALLPNGNEILLWQGIEPAAQAPVDTSFSLPPGVNSNSVKIYLDRGRVPGWNEIDAVELIGRDGSHQWVSSASSSTSYAEPGKMAAETFLESRTRRTR